MARRIEPLVLCLATLLVLAVLPPSASAQEGTDDPLRVLPGSLDAVVAYEEADGPDLIVIADSDNDGRIDADEPVYVAPDDEELPAGSVRIFQPPSGGLGSQVRIGDTDHGATVTELRGEVMYFDADNDGEFGPEDVLFYDVSEDGRSDQVDGGDLILSGPNAGKRGSASAFHGDDLETVRSRFAWSDVHGDGDFGVGDLVAIDAGTEGDHLGPRDVALWVQQFGQMAGADTPGVVYELELSGAPDRFHFLDENGDGDLDVDEPVYLSTDTDEVVGSTILIANTGDATPGQTAGQARNALGRQTESLSGQLRFHDADGSGELSLPDALYHVRTDGDTDEVGVGDVAITGPEAGSIVRGGHPNIGDGLESFDGDIAYVDLDDDNVYTGGEPVVIDSDSDGVLSTTEPPIGALPEDLALRVGVLRTLETFDRSTRFFVADQDGDGTMDHNETLYATLGTGSGVVAGSVRLAFPPAGHAIGSVVASGDDDRGRQVIQLRAGLAYLDEDDDGLFDLTEHAYLDTDGTDDLTAGDVLLATEQATTVLGQEADELGQALTSLSSRLAWSDTTGDEDYGTGDTVYVDVDGNGLVSVGDLGFRSPVAGVPLADLLSPQEPLQEPEGPGPGPGTQDRDGDGVADAEDNCPGTPNANQLDSDNDGTGDACEQEDDGPTDPDAPDTDGDGVPDSIDNCPSTPNPGQLDTDRDGTGDACDGDLDGDGLTNVRERGLGTDPANPDTDGDGVKDGNDNCPTTENPDQADTDGDSTGDACPVEGANGSPGPGALVALLATVATAVAARRRA